jgi:type III restriction enzyme
MSYAPNDAGMFEPEYADVYGVPFSFLPCSGTTKALTPGPVPTRVRALPDRIGLEINWPRLLGYRYELPGERLTATFTADSHFALTNADIPTKTELGGVVGEIRFDTLDDLKKHRLNEVAFRLAELTLEKYFRDDGGNDKPWLFPQLLTISKRWLDEALTCKGGTFPQLLLFVRFAHEAADRIYRAIVASSEGTPTLKPILRPYETVGTTRYVDFHTVKETYETRADRCHVSHVAGDSSWEFKLANELEDTGEVVAYVKNQGLGFTVPYTVNGVERQYYPDFLVRLDDGQGGDPLNLIVEVTGERKKDKEAKTATARTLWVPAVNNHGGFGRWAFLEIIDPYDDCSDLIRSYAHGAALAGITESE